MTNKHFGVGVLISACCFGNKDAAAVTITTHAIITDADSAQIKGGKHRTTNIAKKQLAIYFYTLKQTVYSAEMFLCIPAYC